MTDETNSPARSVARGADPAAPLLRVDGLRARHPGAAAPALEGISLMVAAGEAVAVTGPSGAGKSTLALAVLRLLPAGTAVDGAITFEGRDLAALDAEAMRAVRGRRVAMVFQDAVASLHAVRRVGDQLLTVAGAHPGLDAEAARARALTLFARVDLPDPPRVWDARPYELSGGMCQRVLLAMALLHAPSLLIADEPTASLDAAAAHDVLTLLDGLRRERGMALLLITHDSAVAARHTDRTVAIPSGRAP
ncbi:MAG: ABC transporter ATP-binding protein [Gemmatimonadaceae bacterium]|nr:ABC transporter ATP-binding protein [Gemmatimonadaceae bacterium]